MPSQQQQPNPSHDSRSTRDKGGFGFFSHLLRAYPLDAYDRSVYWCLADHAMGVDQTCSLFQAVIAKESGCSLAKVQMVLQQLVKLGLVLITHGKKYQPNTYQLRPVKPWQAPVEEVPEIQTPMVEGSDTYGMGVSTPPDTYGMGPNTLEEKIKDKGRVVNGESDFNKGKDEINTPPAAETPPPESSRSLTQPIIEAIQECYMEANKGMKPAWTSKAFGMLKREVERVGIWSPDQWVLCVRNRYASDGVALGDLPETFIPYLHRFFSGPLDRFNKLKEYGPNEVSPRIGRTRAAVQEAIRRIDAAAALRRQQQG